MNLDALYSELTLKTNAKLALVVLDGLGDLAIREQNNMTPLEAAVTPNLDGLARDAAQGRMIPVAPGITPGSGPGHLALFGYDPLEFQVGRGVIEALGLGSPEAGVRHGKRVEPRVRSTSARGRPAARARSTPRTWTPVSSSQRSRGWVSRGNDPRLPIQVSGSGCTSGCGGPIVARCRDLGGSHDQPRRGRGEHLRGRGRSRR